jgi:subtilisin inhibitor-like
VILLALALALASGGQTKLSVDVYPQGVSAGGARHYALRCGPAGGTVPHPVKACLILSKLTAPFAPVPKDQICTQIALGPQEAIVAGTLEGARVYARLRLNDGCQIERWRRVSAAVPGFPA